MAPNIGFLNRTFFLYSDYFITPLVPDLFSLRGLENLGPTINGWSNQWDRAIKGFDTTNVDFEIFTGKSQYLGYILLQYNIYRQRPTKFWQEWVNQVPKVVSGKFDSELKKCGLSYNPKKLGEVKNYLSLAPKSQECLKPIFELTQKDGVIGSHDDNVKQAYAQFSNICENILNKIS